MKKFTVLLDDGLHRRLRFMSLETGESLQKVAVRLLQAELARHETTFRKKAKGGRAR